jgi:molybdopterin-containing oxidoreductase family iron-sulfur binding subunit
MSCDENKEAAAEARAKRRSLPIVTAEAPKEAPRYWASIEERDRAKSIALAGVNEFAPGADELPEGSVSRRDFMQLLGVSTAVATLGAACQKPHDKIVPFVKRPEELTPGNPLHFATAYAGVDGFASGLLVTSHEGHPTKVEGNPQHPETLGATTPFDQAQILGLYDDDRLKEIRSKGEALAWRGFIADTKVRAAKLAGNKGAGLRFLVEPNASPLLGELRRRILARFPAAKFVSYGSTTSDGAAEGPRMAFGQPLVARHDLDKAQVILSLDADFLGEGAELTRANRGFAARRTPGPEMNRLYAVEPAMTNTGAMADHRLRMRGTDIASFAAALVAELAGRSGLNGLAPLAGLPKGASVDQKWLKAVAGDLDKNRGKSLVIAGRRQPPAVHALAAAINSALGNVGATVTYFLSPFDGASGAGALRGLVEDIAAGTVDTLVITASNPAYTAPADFKLAQLLPRVANTIYLGMHQDETAAACGTVIPAAHPLEAWGDARAIDGTVSIVQPLIHPLWGAFTETQVLSAFLDEGDLTPHEIVRRYWHGQRPGDQATAFDGAWEKWLSDGVLPGTAAQPVTVPALDAQALSTVVAQQLGALAARPAGLEIGFAADPKVHDGRYGNNAWLQELPHSITKHTWGNAVMISTATAKAQGLETGDVVALQYRDRSVEGPVMIVPGHADDCVTVNLGYGRTGGVSIAKGVGFNAGAIRTSEATWYDRGLALARTGDKVKFALSQEQSLQSPDGRKSPRPAVDGTLAEVLKEGSELNVELEERRGPLPVIHKPHDYSDVPYKWGMSIDLNKCTGCNACVVSCQSENNIPVVGIDNVRKGRHMQWIRIDRYFEGSVEDPEIVNQPLGCVQCETAPCEYVCPVNATVHSDEGLNEMAYNRCIGTRYCSNNCPYKVRRFNFLNYTGDYSAARFMANNPDVTVRTRGIMEKCTYCVQRIERKRIETRVAGTTIKDGELETACQQGCPARAIEFGSLHDKDAKVTKLQADPRRYDLLHEIGTRPRTVHLARVRNPNPELASAEPAKAGE